MSRLEELIAELCPDGVEYKTLDTVSTIERGVRVVKTQLSEDGVYPVFQNCLAPMGYYKDFNCEENMTYVISAGAAGEIGFSETKFWAADDCLIIKNSPGILNKYIYYYLLTKQHFIQSKVRRASIPRLSRNVIEKIKVPVPPLEIQSEIVRILDAFSELKTELKTELKARKEQYAYYLKILAGSENNAKMKRKPLCEIAEIGTGSSNTNEGLEIGTYPFFVRSQEVLRKDEYEFDETAIITSGDGVGVGKILHYVEGKYALHQRAYRIHIIDDKVLPKFFYYYMKGTFLDYIKKECFHSSVTSIRRPMMNKYPVPIIPIEEQKRIVSILDNYEKLCSSLTSGLPAEIEAREKQYEYYRDLLLTFKPKVTE